MRWIKGIAIGLIGSFFGGLVGLGGGVVIVPLLTWIMKLTQHQAHGTSLIAIIFTSLVGAGTYLYHGNVDFKAGLIMAFSATITVRYGAIFAHSLPEKTLKRLFGCFFIFVSIMLMSKGYLPKSGYSLPVLINIAVFLVIGGITGFLSGMLGIGGGAVMIGLMVLLTDSEQHLAQGTSLFAMFPSSINGVITHYKLKTLDINIGLGLAIGCIFGGFLGATVANQLPELYLRFVFATVAIWMGIKYIRTK
ncbi:MAG: sulfite exporter TauE/SafE family protein [Syntrophorhabdaceae bacterium]|nr:sulfite exporter TauE/SafE family protein [Syntrophorhabdaceae bacterium]